MNVLIRKNSEKQNNEYSLDELSITELLDFIDFVKVEVDTMISSSLMHTINNILSSISLNLSLLGINFDIYKMQNDIQNGIKPDFAFLLGSIRMNYKGEEDLDYNKYFHNILKSIKLLGKNLHFNDDEKFSKNTFSIIAIEKYIYDIISTIEHNKVISKKNKIENGYYVKFETDSYLGNIFNIEPIIINLIADLVHNSIKYSNEGEAINISIIQTYDKIIISVLDNGHGIKEENINKVFEHGIRLSNVGDEKGSGKGGYDCAYIVNKLGGKIYVKSDIGKGTEIRVVLPN